MYLPPASFTHTQPWSGINDSSIQVFKYSFFLSFTGYLSMNPYLSLPPVLILIFQNLTSVLCVRVLQSRWLLIPYLSNILTISNHFFCLDLHYLLILFCSNLCVLKSLPNISTPYFLLPLVSFSSLPLISGRFQSFTPLPPLSSPPSIPMGLSIWKRWANDSHLNTFLC